MDQHILQLVKNFSEKLKISVPEFQELREAKQALESDQTSSQLWNMREEQRLTIELMKNKSLPVSAFAT